MTLTLESPALDLPEPRSWQAGHVARLHLHPARPAARAACSASILKVADSCDACGEELHHHRADDAPPYFTMFIVGHIVIPLVLVVEKLWAPALSRSISCCGRR